MSLSRTPRHVGHRRTRPINKFIIVAAAVILTRYARAIDRRFRGRARLRLAPRADRIAGATKRKKEKKKKKKGRGRERERERERPLLATFFVCCRPGSTTRINVRERYREQSLTWSPEGVLLTRWLVIYTFISFRQYLKKNARPRLVRSCARFGIPFGNGRGRAAFVVPGRFMPSKVHTRLI